VKLCATCGKEIIRRPKERPVVFRKRKYCCHPCANCMRSPAEQATAFWAKVDKRGPDECWPWTAAKTPMNYGMVWGLPLGLPYTALATHASILLTRNERVPKGMVVKHSCDNPICVNPAHLSVGTYSENAREAFDRGLKVRRPPARNRWGHVMWEPVAK
jgi:hypothetical protein